jgi:hypothetical protein
MFIITTSRLQQLLLTRHCTILFTILFDCITTLTLSSEVVIWFVSSHDHIRTYFLFSEVTCKQRNKEMGWTPVVHTCHLSYLRGWDWEDHGSRPAWSNSLQDPISKMTKAYRTMCGTQMVECLLCKHDTLSSNSSLHTHTHTKKQSKGRVTSYLSSSLMLLTLIWTYIVKFFLSHWPTPWFWNVQRPPAPVT